MSELKTHLNEQQKQAFLELCKKRKKRQGQMVRQLIEEACKKEGIAFDSEFKWGGKREGKKK